MPEGKHKSNLKAKRVTERKPKHPPELTPRIKNLPGGIGDPRPVSGFAFDGSMLNSNGRQSTEEDGMMILRVHAPRQLLNMLQASINGLGGTLLTELGAVTYGPSSNNELIGGISLYEQDGNHREMVTRGNYDIKVTLNPRLQTSNACRPAVAYVVNPVAGFLGRAPGGRLGAAHGFRVGGGENELMLTDSAREALARKVPRISVHWPERAILGLSNLDIGVDA